jgi:hypothetical protein
MGEYRAAVHDRLVLPARVLLTQGTDKLFRLSGRAVADGVVARLIIDTGSKRSSVIPAVLDHLRAPAIKAVRVRTGLTSVKTELYWVRLEFPAGSLAPVATLAVARLPLPRLPEEYHGLIGRDLLSRWESFHYQGRRARYTIRDTRGGLFGWLRELFLRGD